MPDQSKITEKAAQLAGQAAEAAGPALERAKEVAGELVEKAGPALEKAAEKAVELAAKGVSAAAESADRVTGGKYAEQISSAAAKLEQKLDRKPD